ncbi:hypothetical protein [Clostridium algidicarnis]|uniref:Uncharacterized protein n=2 Tax=Clostridium algidicarnis TaxID=37659 RepID=A0A2S6FV65_9CLOT|nr:hypothetical protein [Clostridium algidicarnis]MBB6630342.1 hypothetical protein [Clostridium algidicarnis]MBU3192855.1 hypothetical protein [Clostridium algidicarnis]MBU3203554.1 hypothetical protein [Clostridium algidicarnis]MBU3206140.1 hypothetical protein [Clostridium algidicarnis]MBU3211708.1 hypothetical protein [Clostridium algidicarnis]
MPYVLLILIAAVVGVILYNLLNVYLLRKINVNKWIVLGVAILVFFLPIALSRFEFSPNVMSIVQSMFFVILLLWFFDLNSKGPIKKEKQIKIKTKAKPNKLKTMPKDSIITNEKDKKSKNKK